MSSGRSRAFGSKITQDEIDLILKLQALLPRLNQRHNTTAVSTSKILEETCNYIRRLHREVDDLSERLTQLLDSMDTTDVDVEILKRFLQQ